MCREVEPSENHLKDMLQQLNSIIAAKPSEKAVVRQGECWLFYDCAAYFIKLDNLRVSASYRDVNYFNKQRRQRILHASPSSGSANGWTTLINMDWVSITLRLHIIHLHLNT